jgi:hypothetical protein
MKDFLVIAAVVVVGMGGLFGFIYLLDRKSKVQSQTGRPSKLIRASAIVMGLVGLAVSIGVEAWSGGEVGLLWFVLPLSLLLLAYGLFGWFATVRPPPK